MEPMTLGSPVSSTAGNQGPYLPSFLMGDSQAAATPRGNTLSPKGTGGRSFANSPGGVPNTSISDLNRSVLAPNPIFGSGIGYQQHIASSPLARGQNYPGTPTRNNSHQTGPPTQSLFDSLQNERNQVQTPVRNQQTLQQQLSSATPSTDNRSLNASNNSLNGGYQAGIQQFTNSFRYVPDPPSMRSIYSPLQGNMSPIPHHYPQPSLATPNGADFWVTVFGFPPGATSMILQHFTFCGTIIDKVLAPQNGNWMHLKFASRINCDKALNYNEKIIGNNIMIGVTHCSDGIIIDKENEALLNFHGDPPCAKETSQNFKVRPLAQQAYQNAQADLAVSPSKMGPQKSSGLVNKAMDLLFGW